MRISGEHIHDASRKLVEQAQQKRVQSAGPTDARRAAEVRADEAVLSPQARDMRVALQAVHNVPQARRQRVEELARKVREGTYRVDSRAVADAMLREVSAGESQ
jgi:flagellar biosynthesis anti-sigma factor FlgM